MGAFSGREDCELIGLCIINTISKCANSESVILYRDDCRALLKSQSGSQSKRSRKCLVLTLTDHGLGITQTNITSAPSIKTLPETT